MTIDVNNESGTTVDEAALVLVARHVLDALRVNPLAELSIVLLDSDAMAALHGQWMELPGPTDVMAFPMDGADVADTRGRTDAAPSPGFEAPSTEVMLGDVVLCPDVAAKQAAPAGHSLDSELQLLCVHGVLHLLGYDHGEPDDERVMFELQGRLLREWTERTGRPAIRTPIPGSSGEVRA